MGKIKEYFKAKGIGFYVLAGSAALTLISIIVYAASYGSNGEGNINMMNIWAVVFLALGITAAAGLSLFKQTSFWAPFALAAFDFLALLFYIVTVYPYITVVMVGIDMSAFSAQFLACTIFLIIALIASITAVFFKQHKEFIA